MNYPGPGTYDYKEGMIKNIPILIKSRTMFYYDEDVAKAKHCISPQKYLPSTRILQNLRYSKIGIGIGNRFEISKKIF